MLYLPIHTEKVDSFYRNQLTTFAEVIDSFPKNVDFWTDIVDNHTKMPQTLRNRLSFPLCRPNYPSAPPKFPSSKPDYPSSTSESSFYFFKKSSCLFNRFLPTQTPLNLELQKEFCKFAL